MKCTQAPSSTAVFAVVVAVSAGICGASIPPASAAQEERASANIQLDVVVIASGGDEGTVETLWRVTTTAAAGQLIEVQTETINLVATVYRSNDDSIALGGLSVTVAPIEVVIVWKIQGLVLEDGEPTVVLESSDPADGSVTIEVTATALDRPRPARGH